MNNAEVNYGKKYYKFSKSSPEVSKFTYEKNFWDYQVGENIDPTDFGFSFVPEDTILLCLQYGDILNCITIPSNVQIKYRGLYWQESAAIKVNVLWQKSLREVETLKYLFRISSNTIIHQAVMNGNNREFLNNMEFYETLELWDEVRNILKYSWTQKDYDIVRELCK